MARIIDKDTRLIDIDFGPVAVSVGRDATAPAPTSASVSGNGVEQIILPVDNVQLPGSFIQYAMVDLEYMTLNNEVMQPVEVSIQRTSPVPTGAHLNGNNADQIEEYIYVFSRPLNNEEIRTSLTSLQDMRSLGLDRTQSLDTGLGGVGSGIPTHVQTIYAEKRMYSYSDNLAATRTNGELTPGNVEYNTVNGMPTLDSVTTWGTLSAITGPSLHAYRVIVNRTQIMPIPPFFVNTGFVGSTSLGFPPVNITFLCKDPNYSEGQYLTTLANAMNNIPEGGPTS